MTMAYIIALNPNLLTSFAVGTPLWNGVFLATCIASAIGTAVMAFLANKPFVMAPGIGLNSFFAVIAGNVAAMLQTDYTSAFQAVLCIILVEGIVFLLLSVFNIRDKIVTAIPLGVRLGIGPAIGLMLMNIGMGSNVGIYAEGNGYTSPFYVLRDFFGAMTPSVIKGHMGKEYSTMVLTAAFMFLACMFIAPVAAIIPAAATSSALIYVGILMLQGLKNVDFDDLDQVVPVFIMLLAMPISGSIGHGIGLAMISYTVIKVFSGRAKDVSALTYVIALLFLVKFFAVV